MNAPTGSEMLIKSVLKMLGIKAEDILTPLSQIRDTIAGADKRLSTVLDELVIMRAEFNVMAQRLERIENGRNRENGSEK
jgi:hypothetical protein